MEKGNLTEGTPFKVILRFALPMLAGVIFQQLYNTVDTALVGKMLGVSALAAVGSTSSISYMILGLCTGTASGFAIPLAHCFGAGDKDGLRRTLYHIIILTVILAVISTALFCVLCRTLLTLMGTPGDIFDLAWQYLIIIYAGIPATLLYNTSAAILRAMGNSKTPVLVLILSALLNIVLDIALIPLMGVRGAALATVIAQLLSGIVCISLITRYYPQLRVSPGEYSIDKNLSRHLLAIGLPMGLQCSITSIGTVLVQTAVNALGSTVVAAFSGACKIYYMTSAALDALGNAMATFCGQNLGAKRPDRIRTGVIQALGIGFAYSLLACLVLWPFTGKIALLFVSAEETAIIDMIIRFMRIYSACYPVLTIIYVVRYSLQGIGRSALAMNAGLFEMAARVIDALFIIPAIGFTGVCIAGPVAWLAADLFLIPAFVFSLRKIVTEAHAA